MRYQIDRARETLNDLFGDLPKRIKLTLEYYGWKTVLFRIVTFPLRLTPLGPKLGLRRGPRTHWATIKDWYRRRAQPVAVVIPTYGDPTVLSGAVESNSQTSPFGRRWVIFRRSRLSCKVAVPSAATSTTCQHLICSTFDESSAFDSPIAPNSASAASFAAMGADLSRSLPAK